MSSIKKIVHSARAKSGTRNQIDGIIEYLEKNKEGLKEEKEKFKTWGQMGKNMIPHIDNRIRQIENQIWEYKSLRADYASRDLV